MQCPASSLSLPVRPTRWPRGRWATGTGIRWVAILLGIAAVPVSARTSPLDVTVEARWGRESALVAGRWVPVEVEFTLRRGDPALLEGARAAFEVQAWGSSSGEFESRFEAPLEPMPGGTWRARLRVKTPENRSRGWALLRGDRILWREPSKEDWNRSYRGSILLTSDRPEVFRLLGDRRPLRTVEPARLPRAPLDLDAVDRILVDDPGFLDLDPGHLQALCNWVVVGGEIVFTPRALAAVPTGPIQPPRPASADRSTLSTTVVGLLLGIPPVRASGKITSAPTPFVPAAS